MLAAAAAAAAAALAAFRPLMVAAAFDWAAASCMATAFRLAALVLFDCRGRAVIDMLGCCCCWVFFDEDLDGVCGSNKKRSKIV